MAFLSSFFVSMEKSCIKELLERNLLDEFKQIFTDCHYHRTKVTSATGIGYSRLGTIVADPGKMTVAELCLLADYFNVTREILTAPIERQIANSQTNVITIS